MNIYQRLSEMSCAEQMEPLLVRATPRGRCIVRVNGVAGVAGVAGVYIPSLDGFKPYQVTYRPLCDWTRAMLTGFWRGEVTLCRLHTEAGAQQCAQDKLSLSALREKLEGILVGWQLSQLSMTPEEKKLDVENLTRSYTVELYVWARSQPHADLCSKALGDTAYTSADLHKVEAGLTEEDL